MADSSNEIPKTKRSAHRATIVGGVLSTVVVAVLAFFWTEVFRPIALVVGGHVGRTLVHWETEFGDKKGGAGELPRKAEISPSASTLKPEANATAPAAGPPKSEKPQTSDSPKRAAAAAPSSRPLPPAPYAATLQMQTYLSLRTCNGRSKEPSNLELMVIPIEATSADARIALLRYATTRNEDGALLSNQFLNHVSDSDIRLYRGIYSLRVADDESFFSNGHAFAEDRSGITHFALSPSVKRYSLETRLNTRPSYKPLTILAPKVGECNVAYLLFAG